MELKSYLATAIVLLIVVSGFSVVLVSARGPPDLERILFIHPEKPVKPPKPPPGGENGFYKLIGAKWQSLPVYLELNPSGSGLSGSAVLSAIGIAAEEWDDGDYSGWAGVTPDLFYDTMAITNKGYSDLAWARDKLDSCNTLIWGNYPTSGIIAVTILWYSRATKTIVEFDIVFDTDYAWSTSREAGKMDLQNIATHELGHGAGLDDLYQDAAYQETMYGYSSLGEISKRDLYTGDKQGITKLYG